MQRLLLLSVVFFWLSSSSYSQDYTYDGQLTQNDIDQGTLYGSPDDIDLMDEGLTYMDQIINNEVIPFTNGDGRDWQATTGCLNASEGNGGDGSWGGTSGGSCANIGTNGDGAIRFGYAHTVVAQTQSAIAEALKIAGITVVGYRYQWKVKNANANDTTPVQMNNQDPLVVTVTVKDKDGNELYSKEYDYSTYIAGWELKYGMEWYDPFISGDKIDTITLEVESYDAGGWAGYWGPEFREAGIYSIFVVEPPDPCEQIPIVDPTCEGFIGEAPSEDPAVKQLVIIESTGSIPLSEDELAVLESLEEENKPEIIIPEQPEVIVEELDEKQETKVDALSIAKNAEANALADAASTVENTLLATGIATQNDVQQSTQQAQQQSQQSMQEAQKSQQQSIEMSSNDGFSIDGDINFSSLNVQSQNISDNQMAIEITIDTFEIAALDNAIDEAFMNLVKLEQNIIREQTEKSEQEEELTEPVSNEEEDELVAAALAGSDDEDAQAALLGFNPNFRQYQQPQMADADFNKPKDIYASQKNYDNPNARFFNGASDTLHKQMVRQQYEGN